MFPNSRKISKISKNSLQTIKSSPTFNKCIQDKQICKEFHNPPKKYDDPGELANFDEAREGHFANSPTTPETMTTQEESIKIGKCTDLLQAFMTNGDHLVYMIKMLDVKCQTCKEEFVIKNIGSSKIAMCVKCKYTLTLEELITYCANKCPIESLQTFVSSAEFQDINSLPSPTVTSETVFKQVLNE